MRARTAKSIDRDERAAAAKQTLLAVSDSCEWCGSRQCWPIDLHHHAGRSGDLIDDVRFLLVLGRPCHQAIEERIMGADGLAVGLALLRQAGRGTVKQYWEATGQNRPTEALVEQWSKRITRSE